MGLSRAAFESLSSRVQEVAEAIWSATVRIGGVDYAAATTGGELREIPRELGGSEVVSQRSFRVHKMVLAIPPDVGTVVIWVRPQAEGGEERLRVVDTPSHPHEPAWLIHCVAADH